MYAIEPSVEMIRPEYLESRNYYQRLGFNDIGPTSDQIEKACRARRKLFKDGIDEFSKEEWTSARNLVEEAYDCLIQPHLRRRYDARLIRRINGDAKSSSLVLNRYQVGQKLSDGDRTTIYEAHDNRLNRDCIIKKIHPSLILDSEHQALLRREAEIFASHNSGHLVKILDFDAPRGIIVLEKMSGNLSSLAKPGGVDSHLIYELLEQSLRGLDALHSQDLAHGRIDHEHLLLDDRGQVKLSVTPGVSGIATALSPNATTKHIAPEMLNPEIFGAPGLALDLYSLGFVILELLVGKGFAKKVNPGFSAGGGDSQAWYLWHASATDHLPPIQELCPSIDHSFASVLEQMVAKDQNKRFASAGECLRALAQSQKPAVEVLMPKSGRHNDAREVRSIGSPDALTDTFQFDRSVSWQQIWSQPKLLLTPDGRQHAAILFVGALVACSMMLILFGSSSPNTSQSQTFNNSQGPEKNSFEWDPFMASGNSGTGGNQGNANEPIELSGPEARLAPENETPSVEMPWQVTFDVEGGGTVAAVDSVANPSGADKWDLMPGVHHASVIDSPDGPARNVRFTLSQGRGSITVPIILPSDPLPEQVAQPAKKEPSPEIVKLQRFHPQTPRIPVVGAVSVDQARAQTRWLQTELKKLCISRPGEQQERSPFVLPARPVDPRYCFVHALRSYQQGDKTKAQLYCQQSLDDAAYFGIVFMPIVQLSSRTHMMRGQCSNALADCRSTLSTLVSRQTVMSAQEKADAISELAWWTGTLVGVIENTEIDKGKTKADTEYTAHEFQQNCSPDDWQWFQAGRKQSAQRANELTLAWQTYRSQREDALQKNKNQLSNRYDDDKNGGKTQNVRLTPAQHTFVRQPNLFSNYVPDDMTILAQRAYNSVVAAKEYQQLTVRR